MSNKQEHGNGCSSKCHCSGGMDRRNFLKLTGAGCAALLTSQMPVMAGLFNPSDFEKLVPSDKKLSPEWV